MNRNWLNWLIFLVVLVIAVSGVYYQYENTRPCAHPIHYSIGAVDSRFNITNATLISDAETAAAIWNNSAGRTVLVYDPKATVKINLVYDIREATAKLGSEIALQESNATAARAALDALHDQLTARQASYNQEVETINARGGASPSEAAALARERESLNALQNSINSKAASFNAEVAAFNTVIRQYNQSAGHSFREGEYVRDSAGERINIFEFIGDTQLERVFAHEFGHALGLDHNSDSNSIMYAENESGSLAPTAADISALKAVCNL